MLIEHLGHACLIARSGRTSILFDPLFLDTHHEGLYEISPERVLHVEAIPATNAVVISHRHFDHFDVPSIDLLPRSMPMIIPPDEIIAATLQELKFSNVLIAEPLRPIVIDDLELIPTPATNDIPENGYLIDDRAQRVWNVIDTLPTPDQIAEVTGRFRSIDLAIVPWQPLLDADISGTDTPWFPIATYARLLQNAVQMDAKAIALGACGFQACSRYRWMNSLIFPVAANRFVADAVRANPRWAGNIFRPISGDALEVGAETRLRSQSLSYCHATSAAEAGPEWLPWARRFGLRAPSLKHGCQDELARIKDFFEADLVRFIEVHPAEFFWHRTRRAIHAFTIVYRDGTRSWSLEFSHSGVRCDLSDSNAATAHTVLTADALVSLLDNVSSWTFVALSGDYWQREWTFQVVPGGSIIRGEPLADPLRSFFAGDDQLATTLLTANRASEEAHPTTDRCMESYGRR